MRVRGGEWRGWREEVERVSHWDERGGPGGGAGGGKKTKKNPRPQQPRPDSRFRSWAPRWPDSRSFFGDVTLGRLAKRRARGGRSDAGAGRALARGRRRRVAIARRASRASDARDRVAFRPRAGAPAARSRVRRHRISTPPARLGSRRGILPLAWEVSVRAPRARASRPRRGRRGRRRERASRAARPGNRPGEEVRERGGRGAFRSGERWRGGRSAA